MRLLVIGGSDADLVLVVVGVRPDTQLAVAAGMDTGVRGALRVDRCMRTNLPDILAAPRAVLSPPAAPEGPWPSGDPRP